MSAGQMRSSLAPFASSMRDPDPDGLRHFAADHFRSTGFIIIHPDWIRSTLDRDYMRVTASTAYEGWGKSK